MPHLESTLGPNAPGGLLVLGHDGAIKQAPAFFRQPLFLEERNVPSIFHLFDLNAPPYLVLNRIFRHPYGGTEFHVRVEGLFSSRHGFRYWPVEDPDRRRRGESAFVIIDDSALLQSQDWERRRLRRAILSDVQDSLSDHFKNRLATVQLLAETLRDAPELAQESATRLLRAVDEVTAALNRVVTGMGDIQSPTDYEDAPVRVSDLATVIPTWERNDVRIKCIIKDVTHATLIPASSIERIVLPVVENAIEASRAGSEVEVVISEMAEGFAHFDIVDEGEGMSERVISRACDPFFTTRTGHLGLGLAHAREGLRDAGGQWQIESRPRHGTRVTLLLPVATADQLFR